MIVCNSYTRSIEKDKPMTAAEIARADQISAKERNFDLRAAWWAAVFLMVFAPFALYAILMALGVLPAAPWSVLG